MGATAKLDYGSPEDILTGRRTSARSAGLADAAGVALLMAVDALAIYAAFLVAYVLRETLLAQLPVFASRGEAIDPQAYSAFVPVYLCVFALSGLYTRRSSLMADGVLTLRACFYATASILIFASMAHVSHLFSRAVIALASCFAALSTPAVHFWLKSRLGRWDRWQRPIILLNANSSGLQAARDLASDVTTGYQVVGIFTDQPLDAASPWPVWYVASVEEAILWCRKKGLRSFLLCDNATDSDALQRRVRLLDDFAQEVKIAVADKGLHAWRVESEVLRSSFLLKYENPLANPVNRAVKRALDIVAGLAIAILFFPALVTIPIWIRRREGGPVLFAHRRLGRGGRQFNCWKFRTMQNDASETLQRILESDEQAAAEFRSTHKLRNDPRVTASGRWLRQTSFDELPQLWNVITGEMSLVGPRPRMPDEAGRHELELTSYLRVPCGLTGLWQISGRNDLSYEERIRLDLFYIRNWSIWLDLVILARTAAYLLRPRGAY